MDNVCNHFTYPYFSILVIVYYFIIQFLNYLSFYIIVRNIIDANTFERNENKLRKGKSPILRIVITTLDIKNKTSKGDIVAEFDLDLKKQKSNLKCVQGLLGNHFRVQKLKIMEVSFLLMFVSFFHYFFSDLALFITNIYAHIFCISVIL